MISDQERVIWRDVAPVGEPERHIEVSLRQIHSGPLCVALYRVGPAKLGWLTLREGEALIVLLARALDRLRAKQGRGPKWGPALEALRGQSSEEAPCPR